MTDEENISFATPRGLVRNSRRFRRSGVFMSSRLHVVRTTHLGETVLFAVANPEDLIQKEHIKGQFFEAEELDLIARYFPMGGVYCDIGANIGNHLIFACKFLHAGEAIVFEPNPTAIEMLEANIYLNGLRDRCVLDFLGVGLGAATQSGMRMRAPRRNLGAGQLVAGEGDIVVRRGDDLLRGRPVDFIKIDVEGMEMDVLSGLEDTFRTHRPAALVEVRTRFDDAFLNWVDALGYEIRHELSTVDIFKNYLIAPAETEAPT